MSARPYVVYPDSISPVAGKGDAPGATYISEPGKVSFGVNDFLPGRFRALHGHNTWELIVVDGSSQGPGYIHFDHRWWRVDPGASVFVPARYPHAWSAGNRRGFRMLWIYGGSREEAGRIWHADPDQASGISPAEESEASVWKSEAETGAAPGLHP